MAKTNFPRNKKQAAAAKQEDNAGVTVMQEELSNEELPDEDEEQPDVSTPAPAGAPRVLSDGFPNPRVMSFWDYMNTLTPQQWEQVIVYLYRKEPKIEAAATGEPAYLEKLTEKFDIDYVRKKWGGRKFLVYVNRTAPNGKAETNVYVKIFRIDAPPIFGDKEQAQPPAAGAGATAEGVTPQDKLLVQLVNDLRQRSNEKPAGVDLGAAMTEALKLQGKGAELGMQFLIEQMGKKGGSSLEALLMPVLVNMLTERLQPANGLSQLREMLEVLRELRGEEAPSAASNPRGGAEPWYVTLLTQLAPRLENIIDKFAIIATANARAAAPPAGARTPSTPPPAAAAPIPFPVSRSNPAAAGAPAQQVTQQDIEAYNNAVVIDRLKLSIVGTATGASKETTEPENNETPEQAFARNMHDEGETAAEVTARMDPDFAKYLCLTLAEHPENLAADPILKECQVIPGIEHFIAGFMDYFSEEPVSAAT